MSERTVSADMVAIASMIVDRFNALDIERFSLDAIWLEHGSRARLRLSAFDEKKDLADVYELQFNRVSRSIVSGLAQPWFRDVTGHRASMASIPAPESELGLDYATLWSTAGVLVHFQIDLVAARIDIFAEDFAWLLNHQQRTTK